MGKISRSNGHPAVPAGDCLLTHREVELVRRLIAQRGESGAMAELGLTRGTLPRVVARLPARRATVEMVRARLRLSHGG